MQAILWMSGALASFCGMAIGARELSGEINTFETLFFRSLIGLLVVTTVIFSSGQLSLFKTQRLKLHTLRNVFHFGGQYGWFLGIGLLPLAEVFAIEFTVPFWTAILAAVFLGESFTWRKSLAVLLGLLGVLVIVKPGTEIFNSASLIVLAAAVAYAVSHTATKGLASTEKPLTILFYMCLIQLPVSLLLAIPNWTVPEWVHWPWILLVGITALTAHFCMTKAMQSAEVSVVVTLDFIRLPLIAMIGVLLYGESVNLSLAIGGVLMLLGNLVNFYKPKAASNQ